MNLNSIFYRLGNRKRGREEDVFIFPTPLTYGGGLLIIASTIFTYTIAYVILRQEKDTISNNRYHLSLIQTSSENEKQVID